MTPAAAKHAPHAEAGVLTLGALGVVFGDVGTSPLYALQAVFAADGGAVKPTTGDVYGILSLVVWSLTLIVSVKFVSFIMRADNDGEGGIMALVALLRRTAVRRPEIKAALVAIGLFGVALFYGDGMITPAISVLSAVEGIEVAAPALHAVVLPATLAVLSALFLAVTGTLLIDSVLFLVVVRLLWRKPLWMVAAGVMGFVTVDLLFLTANVTKVAHGGWFSLLVGGAVFLLLTTWDRGREEVTVARVAAEGPLQEFVDRMHVRVPPVTRLPGVAVYLNPSRQTTPLALRVGVASIRAIPSEVVVVTVETTNSPHVPAAERTVFDPLGYEQDGYSHVTLRFGYQDRPDVPGALALARKKPPGLEVDFNPYHATYFLSHITIVPDRAGGMPRWRKALFVAMARTAEPRRLLPPARRTRRDARFAHPHLSSAPTTETPGPRVR